MSKIDFNPGSHRGSQTEAATLSRRPPRGDDRSDARSPSNGETRALAHKLLEKAMGDGRMSRAEYRTLRNVTDGNVRNVGLASRFIDKAYHGDDRKLDRNEARALNRLLDSPTRQGELASRFMDGAFKDGKLSRRETNAFERLLDSKSRNGGVASRFLDHAFKDGKLNRRESQAFNRLLGAERLSEAGERRLGRYLDRVFADGKLSGGESERLNDMLHLVQRPDEEDGWSYPDSQTPIQPGVGPAQSDSGVVTRDFF